MDKMTCSECKNFICDFTDTSQGECFIDPLRWIRLDIKETCRDFEKGNFQRKWSVKPCRSR